MPEQRSLACVKQTPLLPIDDCLPLPRHHLRSTPIDSPLTRTFPSFCFYRAALCSPVARVPAAFPHHRRLLARRAAPLVPPRNGGGGRYPTGDYSQRPHPCLAVEIRLRAHRDCGKRLCTTLRGKDGMRARRRHGQGGAVGMVRKLRMRRVGAWCKGREARKLSSCGYETWTNGDTDRATPW